MLGNFGSTSPFNDSRPMPGEDPRFSGPYEGQYLDPDQEQAWLNESQTTADYYVYVKSYISTYSGKSYNPHVAWALRIIANANYGIDNAGDEAQEMIIRQELSDACQRNPDQFKEAYEFISEQDKIASKKFVETLKKATDALASGDLESYRIAERQLHHTNPIPIEEIRARLQADQSLID